MHVVKRSAFGPTSYDNVLNSTQGVTYLGWSYPLELQYLVHEHWRSFPKPEIYHTAFLFIINVILIMSSIFGNGLVIWIFSTSKNLRTPSNMLILNLAVFDLVMLMNMPHLLLNTIFGYIVGGGLGCEIYAMIGGISGVGGAITNACIAYDRYKTISNPIDGRLSFPQITLLIIFTWLWTLPFSVLPICHIWGNYIPEGFLTTCSFDYLTDTDETRYFIRSMFTWAYCFPMALICTYYGKLFFHVRDHERMLADQAKKMNVKSLSANANLDAMSAEMRIAKAALVIYLLYVIAWTPYAVISLLGTTGYRHLITPFISMLPANFAKTVSCLDPWVYAASHPKYRLELERRLPWLGVREKNVSVATGGGSETGTIMLEN